MISTPTQKTYDKSALLIGALERQAAMAESFLANRFAGFNEKVSSVQSGLPDLSDVDTQVKLLANVENVVEVSREQLEVERRDMQISRAMSAHRSPVGSSLMGVGVATL